MVTEVAGLRFVVASVSAGGTHSEVAPVAAAAGGRGRRGGEPTATPGAGPRVFASAVGLGGQRSGWGDRAGDHPGDSGRQAGSRSAGATPERAWSQSQGRGAEAGPARPFPRRGPRREGPAAAEPPVKKTRGTHGKNAPETDCTPLRRRICGVDLTRIMGLNLLRVLRRLGAIGPAMSRWCRAPAFCAWLGLCPSTKIRVPPPAPQSQPLRGDAAALGGRGGRPSGPLDRPVLPTLAGAQRGTQGGPPPPLANWPASSTTGSSIRRSSRPGIRARTPPTPKRIGCAT